MSLDDRRSECMERGLHRTDLAADPFDQFARWYADAEGAGLYQPDAMVLATADAGGQPSARFVLFRGYDSRAFRFFTDLDSAKGRDLAADDRAALLFPWNALSRQVRVTGRAQPVSDDEADAYWAERPRGSQIAATVSEQSRSVADRATLDERYGEVERRLEGQPIDRPPRWSGFRVVPDELEFWQGRENRFHDRLRYRRAGDAWVIERLQP